MKRNVIALLLALLLAACTLTIPDAATVTPEPTARPSQTPDSTSNPTAEPSRTPEPQARQRSRVCFNIAADFIPDRERLFSLLDALNCPVVLFMDNLPLAAEFCRNHPDTITVYRKYSSFEGAQWWRESAETTVGRMVEWQRQANCPTLVHYNVNEPGYNAEHTLKMFLAQQIDVMRLAREAGLTVSMSNFGIGTQQPYDIEAGLYDDYLRALVQYGHYLGAHEYTNGILPFGVGQWPIQCLAIIAAPGACTHISNWPARAELPIARTPPQIQSVGVNEPFGAYMLRLALYGYDSDTFAAQGALGTTLPAYWHILRVSWFWLRQDFLGIERSPVLITESPWDHNNDVDQIWLPLSNQYGLGDDDSCPTCFKDLRGVNSLHDDFPGDGADSYWEALFPYWTHAEAAVCQLIWLDSIYPSEVIGLTMFTWSNNIHWATFDFSGYRETYMTQPAVGVHALMRRYAAGEDIWNNVCLAKAA